MLMRYFKIIGTKVLDSTTMLTSLLTFSQERREASRDLIIHRQKRNVGMQDFVATQMKRNIFL